MMNIKILLTAIVTVLFGINSGSSQDTFSIVAVDSTTGEVGSAGASCVNLFQTSLPNDDFLGQLIPNVGAINTQAYYLPANQELATERMIMGETPNQIINWLVSNDVQSQPQFRQYGIAALNNGSPLSAAHTGNSTDDYKNHILGANYAIQGNILLGQEVLDSMEARFLHEPGNLACKLMAALQGANMVGADSRCSANGTSSLFAFVKVAQSNDVFGDPSFNISVRTVSNAGIEPIDSLQKKFDLLHSCTVLNQSETSYYEEHFSIYPNPTNDYINIAKIDDESYCVSLINTQGKFVYQGHHTNDGKIDISPYESGIYFIKVHNDKRAFFKRIIIK